MAKLEGRTALVTGGARGIGRAIALAFADEGADVALGDRRWPDGGAELRQQFARRGRRALTLEADVTQEASVQRLVDRTLAELGHIDILVNNAGILTFAPVESMDVAVWDEMIATHLRGTFLVTHAVLPHMLGQGRGRIINISSQLAHVGREYLSHYVAAKAGIIGFTKSLAREVATRGVLVNCIAPGPTKTDLVASGSNPATTDFVSLIPLRRQAEPEEIASSAVFLASDDASYYVGQVLGPNGGDAMFG